MRSQRSGAAPPPRTRRQRLPTSVSAVGSYPSAKELATITRPVLCTYGARSNEPLVRVAHSLARVIPTAHLNEIQCAAHAAAFDAPANFVRVIAEAAQPT